MRKGSLVVKRTVKTAFRSFGLEVRRWRPEGAASDFPQQFDDPLEAAHVARAGMPATFPCPLEDTLEANAFGFSLNRWHPYVDCLGDLEITMSSSYHESLLKRYYKVWQPRTAAEAIAGFETVDRCMLTELPAHLFAFFPWESRSVQQLDAFVRYWFAAGASEHGVSGVTPESDGFTYHGPVSEAIGRSELRRLVEVYESLRNHGYDRARGGEVHALAVKRGDELRFLIRGGRHRAGAMAALGEAFIPATFPLGPCLVDVADVDHWPQVRRGTWSRRDAIRYVDHLFDFDSRSWAEERDLVARS